MTDLRTQNENIINELLLSLGYTNVTVTRSKHPNVDFQCNMNEAKLLYDGIESIHEDEINHGV